MGLQFHSAPVHVEDEGQGSVVLLVNGLYNDCTAWRPIVQRLRQRHRVVTFDFLNQGRSGEAGLSFGKQSVLIADILAHVGVLARDVVVCGLSAGATLAARLHCESGLDFGGIALMAPNPGTLRGFLAQVFANYVHLVREHGVEVFWRASLHSFYSPAFFEKHPGIHELMVEMLSGAHGASRERLLALIEDDLRALGQSAAASFRCPVLLLAGDQDAIFPLPEIARYRNRCAAPLLAFGQIEGGHAFPFENPVATAEAITSFIDRCHRARTAEAHSHSVPVAT
jgi:pimeloyl-ACP methyl ester carboxylesterase